MYGMRWAVTSTFIMMTAYSILTATIQCVVCFLHNGMDSQCIPLKLSLCICCSPCFGSGSNIPFAPFYKLKQCQYPIHASPWRSSSRFALVPLEAVVRMGKWLTEECRSKSYYRNVRTCIVMVHGVVMLFFTVFDFNIPKI